MFGLGMGLDLGTGATGPSPVTPQSIFGANLIMMLESDSGASASTWTDQTSNGNNATQGTGANQPTVNGGTINGIGCYSFNGTSQFFSLPTTLGTQAGTAAEAFIVAKVANNPGGATEGGIWQLGTSTGELCVFSDGNAYLSGPTNQRDLVFAPGAAVTSPFLLDVYGAAADHAAYVNNSTVTSATSVLGGTAWSATPFLGKDSAALFHNGLVAALYVVKVKATTQQRKDMGKYIFTKWGINVVNRSP